MSLQLKWLHYFKVVIMAYQDNDWVRFAILSQLAPATTFHSLTPSEVA